MSAAKKTGNPKAAAPSPARVIDLDEARAARAEKRGEPVVIKLGGKDYKLPAELPLDYSLELAEGNVLGALGALFGDALDEVRASLSTPDTNELMDQLESIYGVEEGE